MRKHQTDTKEGNMRQFTFKQMVKIVEQNGYVYIRCTGDHYIYTKEGEHNSIVLARKKQINPCIARRIIKEHRLQI